MEPVINPEELKHSNSALLIWGGADITPSFYGHPQSRTTYPGGTRDHLEWGLLKRAMQLDMPIIGICRGAQMLCAAAGGYLLQDVRGHGGRHICPTYDGQKLQVNSLHHQMMAGFEKVDHELLVWNEPSEGTRYIWKDDKVWEPPKGWKEPEFIYFNKIKGFAIQWHPEMMDDETEATQFILKEINERIS